MISTLNNMIGKKLTGVIEVENMEFYAFHGCYEEEQRVGNKFLVNVRMETYLNEAAESDDVAKTINYVEVYHITEEQMMIPSHILENVTKRIIDALYLRFPQLQKVTVKVSKMHPPVGGQVEKTSVTLTR